MSGGGQPHTADGNTWGKYYLYDQHSIERCTGIRKEENKRTPSDQSGLNMRPGAPDGRAGQEI